MTASSCAKAWYSPAAGRSLLSLISKLRHSRFDAVLDLQGLFRTGLLAWLSGCRQRFGPRWREMAHLFYTTSIPPRLEWVHVVDYYLKLVEAMGASDLRAEFVLPEKPMRPAARARPVGTAPNRLDRYAVVIPGSAQTSKCWPAERFAASGGSAGVGARSGGRRHRRQIRKGDDREDPEPGQASAGQSREPDPYRSWSRSCGGAKLVVSNDTGPGHIAAALGRPLVMMFSWSNPLRVGPYGRPQCVVARDISSRGLANRSRNPRHSIQHITLDEVYAKAVEQLEAGGWRL